MDFPRKRSAHRKLYEGLLQVSIGVSSLIWILALGTMMFLGTRYTGFMDVVSGRPQSDETAVRNPRSRTVEESIHFSSDGVTLSGTLFLPASTPPFPAVVLFHGSGPQLRDRATALWFAEHGVASIAYDKRGVGKSGGNFRAVPFMDLADDGIAAVQLLKSRRDIDPKEIGVWGLSQGGWLGPLAASRSSDVAFVIAVSGPGVSPGEQMIVFYENELRNRGLAEDQIREASDLRRSVWTYLATGRGFAHAQSEMNISRTKTWSDELRAQDSTLFEPLPNTEEFSRSTRPTTVWFRREMNYDPIPALRALTVPSLFIFGDRDELVPIKSSVDVIHRIQAEPGNRDFTIEVLPGVDHGMYDVGAGGFGGVSPAYLSAMQDWLAGHLHAR